MKELLLDEQAWWDPRQFDPEYGYEGLPIKDEKLNHIQTHVGYAALAFVGNDFKIRVDEVAPDLAICRSQIINLFEFDAEEVIPKNYRPLGHLEPILHEIVRANGKLAKRIERSLNDRVYEWPMERIKEAVGHLDTSARSIVDFYYPGSESRSKLAAMQKERMELLLGEVLPQPFVETVAPTTADTNN